MDKIEKILRKLTKKEQQAMLYLLEQLQEDYTKIPGLKPLKGKKGWFRVRLGQHRIIFKAVGKKTEIRRITRRNEKTYKDL